MHADPLMAFAAERAQRVQAYGQDTAFQALSQQWLRESMQRRYVYNFDWLGRPVIQYPQDLLGLQELMWQVQPDLIIETGVAHGGSLVFSASLLALLELGEAALAGSVLDPARPRRRVLGIDIDIRPHNRRAIEQHPLAARIQLLQGSSTAPEVVAQAAALAAQHRKVMVLLDSMHTHAHVLAELQAYGPLVSPGSYCVVYDTFVEDMPAGFFPDRPWDPGNSPKSAVHEWLKTRSDFHIDTSMPHKLMVTVAPDGFLRRSA